MATCLKLVWQGLHGEEEIGGSRVGWLKIIPRGFKLSVFPLRKCRFGTVEGIRQNGARDVSWASSHKSPGARRPSEPCFENCFPRSEGRKEQKESPRYRFVTMPLHILGRFPSVRASRDRTPQPGNNRGYDHQE